MKKLRVALFSFLLTIAFGACNASGNVTEIPIAVQPTERAFVLPTSTQTLVPTTDPLTPSAIAQFFHTQEATTLTPETPYVPSYEDCTWSDALGKWALCDPFVDPIMIINISNQTWEFSYQTHYGREIPYPCTRFIFLTKDETYLYFSLDTDCGMADPGFVFSIGVFRWNLNNGEVNEILKASYDFEAYDGSYYSVSISPTGKRMAYIHHQNLPLALTILDLQTGDIRSFPIEEKYTNGGMYSWSEDGTKLVFMLQSKKEYDHFISMVFLDLLKDDSMVTFIENKEFSWISSRVEVTDTRVNIDPYFDAPLFYDIETRILSPTIE